MLTHGGSDPNCSDKNFLDVLANMWTQTGHVASWDEGACGRIVQLRGEWEAVKRAIEGFPSTRDQNLATIQHGRFYWTAIFTPGAVIYALVN